MANGTHKFVVDLGDLRLDPASERKLGAEIQRRVLEELAHLDLTRVGVAGGALGGGTRGMICGTELRAVPSFGRKRGSRRPQYVVDLGDVKLESAQAARITAGINASVLAVVADFDFGASWGGRLGPGVAGFLIRPTLPGLEGALKGFQ